MGPELAQHPLAHADGSAILRYGLYTVIAGVNGPVEVQRRDELPEQSAIEVHVRPASGSGGPRERWLETVIQPVLKSVMLLHMHPRSLIQITLQITKEPGIEIRGTTVDLSVLPTLFNAALAALADGGLPLATTAVAVCVGVDGKDSVIVEPQEKDLAGCKSVHALVYNARGEQLLCQSSGIFDLGVWDQVADAAQQACDAVIARSDGGDATMADGEAQPGCWLSQALEKQAQAASAWRG